MRIREKNIEKRNLETKNIQKNDSKVNFKTLKIKCFPEFNHVIRGSPGAKINKLKFIRTKISF